MSELKANVHTIGGMVLSTNGFPVGQIAQGTSEEYVIVYAMSGGWELAKVSSLQNERVLEFQHTGEYRNVDVLIAQYQRGSMVHLWSTVDEEQYRLRFTGVRSYEAPEFLAHERWSQVVAVEGRGYYIRIPKKIITAVGEYFTEMYI